MVSSFSSSSLTVESVPLLKPTFEQPDEGTEPFSCREKTGLWSTDLERVDNGVAGVEVMGGGAEWGGRVVRVEGKVQQVQQGHEATHESWTLNTNKRKTWCGL